MSWFQPIPRIDLAGEHAMLLSEVDFSLAGLRFVKLLPVAFAGESFAWGTSP